MSEAPLLGERPAVERATGGHAVLYMAPTIVQSLLPLITLPIFTRVLSREEYGLWGLATASGVVVSSSFGLGLQIGYERSYFEAPDEAARGRLLCSVVLFALVAQSVGLLGLVAFGPHLAFRLLHSAERSYLLVLAFGVAAIGSLKVFFLTTLRNEGRVRDYVRYSVDELVLGTVLSLAFVLWLRIGVAGLLAGPLLASGLVLCTVMVRFAPRLRLGLDGAQLRDTLRVSLPLAPRVLIGAVGNQLDRLVLGVVGSLAEVGLYTIGQRVAQMVFASMTALQNVYQPEVYRMLFGRESPRTIGTFLLPFAFASAAIALGAVLFAREIIRIVAPREYALAAPILAILSVHYGLMFFAKQPQLVFARRTGLLAILSGLAVAINGLAAYLGARAAGPLGAASGILIAGIVMGAASLALATRYAPINYPRQATTLTFGALPAALAVVLSLQALDLPTYVSVAIRIVLFACFLAAGWRAGLVRAVWRGRSGTLSASERIA